MSLHISIRQIRPGCFRLRHQGRNHRERSLTVHGTEADAKREAAKWSLELEATGFGGLTQSATLGAVIRQSLRFGYRRSAGTMAKYEKLLRLYIEPVEPATDAERAAWRKQWGDAAYGFTVGRRAIGRLTMQDGIDFQEFLSRYFTARAIAGSGNAGAATIAMCMRLCSSALDFAVGQGAIRANPWKGVPRIKYRDAEIVALSHDRDLAAMIAAADKIGGRPGMLIKLAWATGARRGELLALRWQDIDLDTGEVGIGASLQQLADGVTHRKATKTRAGRRTIVLPLSMLAELRAWRARQIELALFNGWRTRFDRSPLFADERGNDWRPDAASQAVRRALHDNDLPVSLHSIRHSFASKLMSSQQSPKSVATLLGHSTPAISLRYYGHTMHGDAAAAAAIIDRVMVAGKNS